MKKIKKAPAMLEASRSVATATVTSFCKSIITYFLAKANTCLIFFGGKFYGRQKNVMEKS